MVAHFVEVLTNAQHGKAIYPGAEARLEDAPDWYREAQATVLRMRQAYITGKDEDGHLVYEGVDPETIARMKANAEKLDVYRMTAVVAALSPQTTWASNLTKADKTFQTFLKNPEREVSLEWAMETRAGMYDDVILALKMLKGAPPETLTGTKRMSFWNNMVDPDNTFDATIDGWMLASLRLAGLTKDDGTPLDSKVALSWFGHSKGKTVKGVVVSQQKDAGYVILADALRKAAKQLDMRPSEAQALYWVAIGGGSIGSAMWPSESKNQKKAEPQLAAEAEWAATRTAVLT